MGHATAGDINAMLLAACDEELGKLWIELGVLPLMVVFQEESKAISADGSLEMTERSNP
jgi:hypothetical protein